MQEDIPDRVMRSIALTQVDDAALRLLAGKFDVEPVVLISLAVTGRLREWLARPDDLGRLIAESRELRSS